MKTHMLVRRSAVGFARDGTMMILATSSGTTRQMAGAMLGLGAYQAMAFDGLLNNALLVLRK